MVDEGGDAGLGSSRGGVRSVGLSVIRVRERAKQDWGDRQSVKPSLLECAIALNGLAFVALALTASAHTPSTSLSLACLVLTAVHALLVVWLFFTRTSMLLLRSLARQWNVVYVCVLCVLLLVVTGTHSLGVVAVCAVCFHVLAVLVTIFSDLTNSSLFFQVFMLAAVTTASTGSSVYVTVAVDNDELWFESGPLRLYIASTHRILLLNITMCMLSAIYTLCRFQNKKYLFLRTHENRDLELAKTPPPTTLGLHKRAYQRLVIGGVVLMPPGYFLRRYAEERFGALFFLGYLASVLGTVLFLKGNVNKSALRRMWHQFRVLIIVASMVGNIVLSAINPADDLSLPNSFFHALGMLLVVLCDVAVFRELWFTRLLYLAAMLFEFSLAVEAALLHSHRNDVLLRLDRLSLRQGAVHSTFFFNISLQFGIVAHTSLKDSLQLRLMFFDWWVDKRGRESLKRQVAASPAHDLVDADIRENAFGKPEPEKPTALAVFARFSRRLSEMSFGAQPARASAEERTKGDAASAALQVPGEGEGEGEATRRRTLSVSSGNSDHHRPGAVARQSRPKQLVGHSVHAL